jgi:hypothetical protein
MVAFSYREPKSDLIRTEEIFVITAQTGDQSADERSTNVLSNVMVQEEKEQQKSACKASSFKT